MGKTNGIYETDRIGLKKEQDHLKNINQKVNEKVEKRKTERNLSKKEELKLREYYRWGTTEFYEKILMPGSSEEIEKELQAGPPKELSKAEKKSWKAYRKNRYDMALKRENFFAITQNIRDKVTKKVEGKKEEEIAPFYQVFRQLEEEVDFHPEQLVKKEKESFQDKDESEMSKMTEGLRQILKELKKVDAIGAAMEQLRELLENYCEIEKKIFPVKILGKKRLKNLEMTSDFRTLQVFLNYAVTALLVHCTEQLPVGHVEEKELATLKGLSGAYGILANKMEQSREYGEKLEKDIAVNEKNEMEQGLQRQEREEQVILTMEMVENLLQDRTEPEPVKRILKEELVKHYKSFLGRTSGNSVSFPKLVKEMLTLFSVQWEKIEEKMKEKVWDTLGLEAPGLLQDLMENMGVLSAGSLLEDLSEAEAEKLVQRVMENNQAKLERLSERRDYLTENENLYWLRRIPASILLKMEKITELIEEKNTQEEYRKQIDLLEEQVSYTLTLADEFLAEKLSPLTRKVVFDYILEHRPLELVFGTFTGLWNLLEYYTGEIIPKEIPWVEEKEAGLLTLMRKLKMKEEWKGYIFESLTGEDTIEKAEEKLKDLKNNILSNEELFGKIMAGEEFPMEKWALVLEWKKSALNKSPEIFKKEMEEEIKKEDYERRDLMSLESYLEEENEETTEIDISANYTNKGLLKWDLLCHWQGFDNMLSGLEEEVLGALDELLKKGSLTSMFSFLENIHSLDDLESLTYTELQSMAKGICLNMSKGIEGWNPLVGTVDEEIWKAMIPEMILGTLEEQNAVKRAKELGGNLRENKWIRYYRIRHALRTEAQEEAGVLKHHHKDDTTNTKLMGKNSRVAKRKERFQLASDIWQVLKKYGQADEGIRIIRQMGIESYSGSRIHSAIGALLGKISRSNRMTDEMRRLCESIELNEIKEDKYVNEFRLCGMEGFLLDKKYDEDAYYIFTQKGMKEGYKELLREKGELVTERILQIDRIIKKAYEGSGFMPNRDNILLKLGPFLAGIKEGEEHKKENLKKFGVEDWQEALQVIVEEFEIRRGRQSQLAGLMELRHIDYGKRLKERRGYLEQYEEGAFKPVLPLLLQDEELWQSILTDTNGNFLQKIASLYTKMKEPLKLLRERFSYGEEFVRQLTEDLGRDILYGKEKNSGEWKEVFQEYFNEFCEHKVAGYSITMELKHLEEKDPKMAGYLTEMLLTHPEGLNLITDKAKFRNTLEQCKKYVKPNTITLNNFLVSLPQKLTEGEETGFRIYARKSLLSTEPEKLLSKLPDLWEEFGKLQEQTKQQAMESARAMEKKANIFLEFEERRVAAKKKESLDNEKVLQMNHLLQSCGSPILAALGVKQMPSPGAVEKAKKRLADYGELSHTVRNCLLEILLSGMEEKQIRKHLVWLQGVEGQIKKLEFAGGEKLKEGAIGSFLTFLYIRHQSHILEGRSLSSEEIIEEFHVMGQRLLKLKELRNKEIDRKALQRKEESTKGNKLFMSKRRELTQAMSVGMFLMEEEEFHGLITRQSTYLEKAVAADQLFEKILKERERNIKDYSLLRIGLSDYFYKDILEETSLREIQARAEQLLKEKNSYDALIALARMNQKFVEGKALMEGISSTGLEEEEQKLSSTPTRESLESFLARKHNEKFLKEYNKLDRDQRRVFALAVLQTEKNRAFPSMKFIRSDELEETRQEYIHSCLERYQEGKDFHPEIFYDRVLEILQKENGRMKEKVFYHAMEVVAASVQKRRSHLPKEIKRLSDSQNSIKSAAAFVKEAEKGVEQVGNIAEWKKVVLSYDEQEKGRIKEIKERFLQLDKFRLPLLIAVLQDRTILDKSTMTGTGTNQSFVNLEEREITVNELRKGRGPKIISQTINQALLTLRSYQLRDDVELINQKLSKKDFAPGALERKTGIDWELLEKAMELVKTIE